MRQWHSEIRELMDQPIQTARLADLQERIARGERQLSEIREGIVAQERLIIEPRDLAKALSDFDPIWESLTPREQIRIVQLLVARVDYNGETGKVAVTFHPSGIRSLTEQLAKGDAA